MRVCCPEGGELGSENNPIVVSDSDPLGAPSNLIINHCYEGGFSTDRLSDQPPSDADTEIMCPPKSWNDVMGDIDPDSLKEGLCLDSEASSQGSYPSFDETSTVGLLPAGLLLNGSRRDTITSTLHESCAEASHAEKQNSPEISGTIPANQVLPNICSSPGKNQTATQLPSREFQFENVRWIGHMEDDIARLGSPSNIIHSRIGNASTSECTTEEHASWFTMNCFQPTETGQPSADQVEEIDPTSVPCLGGLEHKNDFILGKEQSWVDVDKSEDAKHQADIGFLQEIYLSYANSSVSNPKNTEVFERIGSEDIRHLSTGSPALCFEKTEEKHSLDTDSSATKVDDDIVSPEPEAKVQPEPRSSTPEANINVIALKPEDGDPQDASPTVREGGLILKRHQKDFASSKWETAVGIRGSERVAKRRKIKPS